MGGGGGKERKEKKPKWKRTFKGVSTLLNTNSISSVHQEKITLIYGTDGVAGIEAVSLRNSLTIAASASGFRPRSQSAMRTESV